MFLKPHILLLLRTFDFSTASMTVSDRLTHKESLVSLPFYKRPFSKTEQGHSAFLKVPHRSSETLRLLGTSLSPADGSQWRNVPDFCSCRTVLASALCSSLQGPQGMQPQMQHNGGGSVWSAVHGSFRLLYMTAYDRHPQRAADFTYFILRLPMSASESLPLLPFRNP